MKRLIALVERHPVVSTAVLTVLGSAIASVLSPLERTDVLAALDAFLAVLDRFLDAGVFAPVWVVTLLVPIFLVGLARLGAPLESALRRRVAARPAPAPPHASYMTDVILDVRWSWGWEDRSATVRAIVASCKTCDLELSVSHDQIGRDSVWCFRCDDGRRYFENGTGMLIHDVLKLEIERRGRLLDMGFPLDQVLGQPLLLQE